MGTNTGPQPANVYLHEYKYDVSKLEDILRFQDALCVVLNDDGLFSISMSDI